jgi:hypothetical protein
MGCILREAPLHCCADGFADLRIFGYQGAELASIDHVDNDVGLGHDGRYALPIFEERNLAEEVAGTARGHGLIVNEHIDSAFQNNDELTSYAALAGQFRSPGQSQPRGLPPHFSQVVFREPGEQGDFSKHIVSCLRHHAMSSHGQRADPICHDGLADLNLGLANLLLDFTGQAVPYALRFQVRVRRQVAEGYFRLALHLICLSGHLVSPSPIS